MRKNNDRKIKKLSMGKTAVIGIVIALAVILSVTGIGAYLISTGKFSEGEIESVATAALLFGAMAGTFCCSKIGGNVKTGLGLMLLIVTVRIVLGAFSEAELICSCTLSSVLAAVIGGTGGLLLAMGRKKRRRV